MGATASVYLNISTISSIIQCSAIDLENMLREVEGREKVLQGCDLLFHERLLKRQQAIEEMELLHAEYRGQLASTDAQAEKESDPNSSEQKGIENNEDGRTEVADEESKVDSSIPPPGSPFAIGDRRDLETYDMKQEGLAWEGAQPRNQSFGVSRYELTPQAFSNLLIELDFDVSDADIMNSLYCLIDKRGFRHLDVRAVLIAMGLLVSKTLRDAIELALHLFDRAQCSLIEKADLLYLFRLLNDILLYFGDRHLLDTQIIDLVDSVFTSAGKLEGEIFYPDYLDLITEHPIVEMVQAPQYQGNSRDKLMDEETLAKAELVVR